MTLSSKRGCSHHRSKDPSRRLFILKPPTGFNGTFLKVFYLDWTLSSLFPGELKTVPEGWGGGFPSAFHAAGLPTRPSVVLSGSCSQQYASRRGDAVLFADKEVVDFLEPRRDSHPWRSKVIPADLSSCLRHSLPVLGVCLHSSLIQRINLESRFSRGHRRWWRNYSFATFSSHYKKKKTERSTWKIKQAAAASGPE